MKSRVFSYADLFWLNGERCGVCGKEFKPGDSRMDIWVGSAHDNGKTARISASVCTLCLEPVGTPDSSGKSGKRRLKTRTERQCSVCGTNFLAKRYDARHCSPRCRQRASRAARAR